LKDIILILGSGSARGLSHIGVINVLEEKGYRIREIFGCSIGALIGGLYAAGLSGKELKKIALSLEKKDIIKFFTPTFSISGLIDGHKIRKFLHNLIGNPKIEDLRIPFTAVATDLMKGEEVIFKRGSLIESIRASISIPGIFTPVKHKDTYLVDGGIVNPLPINHVKKTKGIKIIAVNVIPKPSNLIKKVEIKNLKKKNRKHNKKLEEIYENIMFLSNFTKKIDEIKNKFIAVKNVPNIFNVILRTISIIEYKLVKESIDRFSPDILIEPDTSGIAPLEFFKQEQAITAGEKEFRKRV